MQAFVLADLGLTPKPSPNDEPPDYDFTGTMFPNDDVIEMYIAWREHGVMAVTGGFLDQPIQWHRDMQVCRILYNVLAFYAVRDEQLKQAAQYTMDAMSKGQLPGPRMSFGNGE